MFPVLITNRLRLTSLEDTDVESVFFLRSNEEVIRYIRKEPCKGIQEAYEHIQLLKRKQQENESTNWAIREKENAEMIGGICLWNFSDDRKTAEVGYDLKPSYHRKGLMSEALDAVIQYGFSEIYLDEIEAFTHRNNEASKSLLLKHGFVLNPERTDDGFPDNQIFELKRDKYKTN